jgi:hypothetical protein
VKNSTKRALRTFLQSFVGYIAANLVCIIAGVDITTKEGLKVLLINLIIPAISTAMAKVMNIKEDEGEDNGENE